MEGKARQKVTLARSNKPEVRGLMLGRFQPFHNGHLSLAQQILDECDELIVGIGSAQFNFIEKDPFTAGERMAMIHNSLSAAGADLNRCYIVPFPNDENNARWLAHIQSLMPEFHVVYSGNEFVQMLLSEQDSKIEVRQPKFVRMQEYNGTNLRQLMADGREWKSLVPDAVAEIIDQVRGVERVRTIRRSDSAPHKW